MNETGNERDYWRDKIVKAFLCSGACLLGNVYGYLLHLLTELPKLGETPAVEQLDSFMSWAKLPDFCK